MQRIGKLFLRSTELLGLVLIIFLAAFFFSGKEKLLLSNESIFNKNQYLFAGDKGLIETFDLNVVEGAFLDSPGPPFLVSGKTLASLVDKEKRMEVEEYVVQKEDTLSSIAEDFNISLETILWANNLSRNSTIKPGQKLVILPVSGILHVVQERDTLSEIAQLYQAEIGEIVKANGLVEAGSIYAGDLLIIPGGKKPKIVQKYVQVPLAGNYFICPIASPCRITQGLHWFNAVDFSNGVCGEPVFAAAGGTVQRTGYGNISGYYARILHPNGVVTFYGHLSKAVISPGQKVYQGQIIGYVGHSGLTVPRGPGGCHLHFDVRFTKNPFSVYPVGQELGR